MKKEFLMKEALVQAKKALKKGEVPIGAVVVLGDEIIGRGYNQPITTKDPTAHAEIIALKEASNNNKRPYSTCRNYCIKRSI